MNKHYKYLLTRSDRGKENEKNDRTVRTEVLGKPQVFTLYVDNQIVGHGAYHAENKYDTLPKK